MADPIYTIPENPVYDPEIRVLKKTDEGNAETVFNPLFSKIINNVHSVKRSGDNLANQFATYKVIVDAALLALENGSVTQEEYEQFVANIGAGMIKYSNSDFPNVGLTLDELFTLAGSQNEK